MISVLLQNKAIGGYFELELPLEKKEYHRGALKYQSARAAFLSLLMSSPEIKRIWMPSYICDTMISPVRQAGKDLIFYSINQDFYPAQNIQLESTDVFFYVSYFGVCRGNIEKLLKQYNPEKIVVDCSQDFFSESYDCLATIYSPRKFFGVPDGGFLVTKKEVPLPSFQDEDSLSRAKHLLQRLAFSAEQGYENYKLAEESLFDMTPKRMSKLTEFLLSSIEYEPIKIKRKRNFNALHESIGSYNRLKLDADSIVAPMCYPFLPKKPINKMRLIEKRIFLPTYWPEVKNREEACGFEIQLVDDLLAIPCDQRYVEADISRVIKEVSSELLSQGN